jgi:hypothetical protein
VLDVALPSFRVQVLLVLPAVVRVALRLRMLLLAQAWAEHLHQQVVDAEAVLCSNLVPWGVALVLALISMIRITIPKMTKGHLLLVLVNPVDPALERALAVPIIAHM